MTNWTAWEAPGRQERIIWTACEAPGRQERTIWTAWRHQGCRRGLNGQPARHRGRIGPSRHQISTRKAGKDPLDSLGGTREAPGAVKGIPDQGGKKHLKDHLNSLGATREAPGRQERTNWTT